jgi:hypothetical protein
MRPFIQEILPVTLLLRNQKWLRTEIKVNEDGRKDEKKKKKKERKKKERS